MATEQMDACRDTVLLVVISPVQRDTLTQILENEGLCVDVVDSVDGAIAHLGSHPTTMVISDVALPDLDGFELCRRIKADPQLGTVPVILLSPLDDPQDIIRGVTCGAENFISKPYEKSYLLTQIQYVMANYRLRRLNEGLPASPAMTLEVFFGGRKQRIKADQLRTLDVLLSTFEDYVRKNKELEQMNRKLAEKQEKIKAMQRLVPICANCKKIRDDDGYWTQVDRFLEEYTDADFSYGICPGCVEKEQKEKNGGGTQ